MREESKDKSECEEEESWEGIKMEKMKKKSQEYSYGHKRHSKNKKERFFFSPLLPGIYHNLYQNYLNN